MSSKVEQHSLWVVTAGTGVNGLIDQIYSFRQCEKKKLEIPAGYHYQHTSHFLIECKSLLMLFTVCCQVIGLVNRSHANDKHKEKECELPFLCGNVA